MSIGSQATDRAAIFGTHSTQIPFATTEDCTMHNELTFDFTFRTLELNRVGYLKSSFVHLLPDMSGPGWMDGWMDGANKVKKYLLQFNLLILDSDSVYLFMDNWVQCFEPISLNSLSYNPIC